MNAVDEKLLGGCNYITHKTNEYLGWNKYSLSTISFGAGTLGCLYVGGEILWDAISKSQPSLTLLSLFSGWFGAGLAHQGFVRNPELEKMEEQSTTTGVIPGDLEKEAGTQGRSFMGTAYLFAFSTLFSQGIRNHFFPYAGISEVSNTTTMGEIAVALWLSGMNFGFYFRSCDYHPRGPGKLQQWWNSLSFTLAQKENPVSI